VIAPVVTDRYRWEAWRAGVVAVLREDFSDILPDVDEQDIHWEAWRAYYDDGRAPRAAVDRAFERI